MTKTKLLSAIAALVAALALAPASFGQSCTDCGGDGGGGGGGGNNPPTAAFSSGPASPQTFDNVTFTNSSSDSDGSIASSSWDFGDGTTSTATSPTHAYANGGTYNVTLTVTDSGNATAIVTHQVTVANRTPTASFSAPGVGFPGQNITFTNQSTDPEGHVASYEWTFGDGQSSSNASPAHWYGSPGTYQVILKVTDDKGAWAFASQNVRINGVPDAAIVVGADQVAGTPVQFGSDVSDTDGTVDSLSWDFGDGSHGTGAGPAHTYAAAGDYTVKLTATDNDGSATVAETVVHVAAAPAGGGGDDGGGSNGGGATGGGSNGGGTGTGSGTGDSTGTPVSGGSDGGGTATPTDAAPAGGQAGSDNSAPALLVPGKLKAKKKAGKLVYTVSTNEAATVRAKLEGKVTGSATVKIIKAGAGKVVIKLSGKAKRALRAAKSVKLTLVTTATDAAGNRTSKTTKVTLV
jgi:PKD repeat protein